VGWSFMNVGDSWAKGFGWSVNLKKGGKYGGEEDFDDCWGFCGGL